MERRRVVSVLHLAILSLGIFSGLLALLLLASRFGAIDSEDIFSSWVYAVPFALSFLFIAASVKLDRRRRESTESYRPTGRSPRASSYD